jgi:hypothetical protein
MKHGDHSEDPHSGDVPAGREESLWWLTASPSIWAVHFLASYLTAAVWCARFAPPDGSLTGVRWAIGAYTAAALLGIAAVGWHGLRRHAVGSATVPHDFDTPEDRHRFLGFATLLLSGLSAVAVVYGTFVIFVFRSCR